jgi:hypothetical protein
MLGTVSSKDVVSHLVSSVPKVFSPLVEYWYIDEDGNYYYEYEPEYYDTNQEEYYDPYNNNNDF